MAKRAPKPPTDERDIVTWATDQKLGPWDAILFGDGSGVTWGGGIGWTGVLVDNHGHPRKEFSGAMSDGTVYVAEIMPTIHAMLWYCQHVGKELRRRLGRPLRLWVITDSEAVAGVGRRLHSAGTSNDGAAAILWAAIAELERMGIEVRWKWIPRESVALNVYCDTISRICRETLEAIPAIGISINELNPNPLNSTSRGELAGSEHRRLSHFDEPKK